MVGTPGGHDRVNVLEGAFAREAGDEPVASVPLQFATANCAVNRTRVSVSEGFVFLGRAVSLVRLSSL